MTTQQPTSIIVPEQTHNNLDYPPLIVGLHRLKKNNQLSAFAQSAGITFGESTWRSSDFKGPYTFLSHISRDGAIALTLGTGLFPLNFRRFVDFLRELRDGMSGKKKVFLGNGSIADKSILEHAYKHIIQPEQDYRGEYLSDIYSRNIFQGGKDFTVVTFPFINGKNKLEIVVEPLEKNTLTRDEHISLDSWIDTATHQGLPSKRVQKGETSYFAPFSPFHYHRMGALFSADNSTSCIGCNTPPSLSYIDFVSNRERRDEPTLVSGDVGIRPARVRN